MCNFWLDIFLPFKNLPIWFSRYPEKLIFEKSQLLWDHNAQSCMVNTVLLRDQWTIWYSISYLAKSLPNLFIFGVSYLHGFFRKSSLVQFPNSNVNVMINVMIIGQPPVTAIFRWLARLAYENTFTVMDRISGTTLFIWFTSFSKKIHGLKSIF